MSTHAVLVLLALALLLGSTCCAKDKPDSPTQTVVYHEGDGGYHTYRIPALIVTKKGTLNRGDLRGLTVVYTVNRLG